MEHQFLPFTDFHCKIICPIIISWVITFIHLVIGCFIYFSKAEYSYPFFAVFLIYLIISVFITMSAKKNKYLLYEIAFFISIFYEIILFGFLLYIYLFYFAFNDANNKVIIGLIIAFIIESFLTIIIICYRKHFKKFEFIQVAEYFNNSENTEKNNNNNEIINNYSNLL